MDCQPSVLIVDRSEETQEVLSTVLQRRGMHTLSARRAAEGLAMARQHHPDLIVLDLECDTCPPEQIVGPFADEAVRNQAPLVVLGTLRRGNSAVSDGQMVPKPYHYGPLIRKIEELLEVAGRLYARSA